MMKVTYTEAKVVLQKYCAGGGCHGPGTQGGHNLADTYNNANDDSYYCDGMTKAECLVVRIEDGSMPQGAPNTVEAADLDLLKAWVDAGWPEK